MKNKLGAIGGTILELIFITLLLINVSYSQEVGQNTSGAADKSLKSSARINPSTLAMEFSLPIANYPGRGGNSVPVNINYSSKLWQLEQIRNWSMQQSGTSSNRIYYTDTNPKFAERSSAGWTSSLVPPRLEIKQEFYDENGKPWSFLETIPVGGQGLQPETAQIPPGCHEVGPRGYVHLIVGGVEVYLEVIYVYCFQEAEYREIRVPHYPPPGTEGGWVPNTSHQIKYVKRVRVYMPDGSSHEFRQDDSTYAYCTTAQNNSYCNGTPNAYVTAGSYLSVDGSKMRLDVGNTAQHEDSTLYLPNGGRFIFSDTSNRGFDWYGTKYIDVNGNQTVYEQTAVENDPVVKDVKLQGTVRDTLDRKDTSNATLIVDPLAQNKEVNLKVSEQPYKVFGINGNPQEYTLKWEKLEDVIDDPATQPISYIGKNVCFVDGSNTLATHTDGPALFSPELYVRVCSSGVEGRKFNPVVLSKVTLPNNAVYSFKYNQFGEITEIKYPTGAYEKFEYGIVKPIGSEPSSVYDQTNRGVNKHWVYESDGSLQNYREFKATVGTGTYPISETAPYVIETTERDGTQSVRYLHRTGKSKYGFADPTSGMPYEEYFYGIPNNPGNNEYGKLLRRKHTEWASLPPINGGIGRRDPYVKSETNYIFEGEGDALKQTTTYEYDGDLNVKKVTEYPYEIVSQATGTMRPEFPPEPCTECPTPTPTPNPSPAVTPVRITETTYLVNDPNITDQLLKNAYRALQLIGLPTLTVIKDGQGNPIAKTQAQYDEPSQYYSLDTSYSTSVGYQAPTGNNATLRGNVTTGLTWVKETDSWLQTHAQYDTFGNLRKSWDLGGSLTETEYGSQYYYAYPTKMTAPAPDPNNTGHGTNLTSKAETVYDPTTGLPTEVKDDFGQITKTEYDDMLRPKRVLPVVINGVATGPIMETEYGEPDSNGQLTAGQRFVKVKKQIDGTNWDEATTWFDGLDRTIKTQSKDSQGDVFVETQYDAMGRVKQVSNPYRQTDAEIYWTKTSYDELGRTDKTYAPAVNPENAQLTGTVSNSISTVSGFIGTVGTTTDASGRKSRSITNSQGQLLRVDEPTAFGGTADADLGPLLSPAQPTFYTYSPQGKMVKVQQGKTGEPTIQYRYFKYDSLGRLIRIKQPEQDANDNLDLADSFNTSGKWSAAFSYDILGNLKTTTDAKGITTINEYDKASRLIKRCYTLPNIQISATTTCDALQGSQIDTNTPKVEYFYDGKGLTSQQSPNYAKGALTKVASSISETRYTHFDNFRRLTESEQKTPAGDETMTNAPARVSKYTYNLSGALIKQEYPSGRTVENQFEPDGDLMRVYGKANSTATDKTYANSFSCTAAGATSQVKLGNGKWETTKFNERLQVKELGLGSSSTDTSLWKVNYDYGELNAVDGTTVDAAKNTGNIAKQTLSFNGLTNPLVQTYKYDSLYRLKEAKETVNNGPTQTWKQTFDYDRFGNRIYFSQQGGSTPSAQPTIDATKNRFALNQGYEYDKNGNITKDTINSSQVRNFIFNAENKQTEVKNASDVTIGQYFYDGEGKRVKKKVFDSSNTLTDETVFVYDGLGKLVAEYSTQPPVANPTISYTTTDQLGSPRVITNSNGAILSRRDFMPFGEELPGDAQSRTTANKYPSNNQDGVRQRFTGYQKDKETNLDFAEARYYNNGHARFTAVDPLLASGKSANPQTFNRYVYVGNNPINITDPLGLDWYYRHDPDIENRTQYQWFDGKADDGWSAVDFGGFNNLYFRLSNADDDGKSIGVVYLHRYVGNYLTQNEFEAANKEQERAEFWAYLAMYVQFQTQNELEDARDQALEAAQSLGERPIFDNSSNEVIQEEEASILSSAKTTGLSMASRNPFPTGKFYSVAFEMNLKPTSYPGVSRYKHFKEANIALDEAMQTNPLLSKLGISVPRSPSGSIIGKSPTNWVWHHDINSGVMQLVPKSQHPNVFGGKFWETLHPGGIGGFSRWGK